MYDAIHDSLTGLPNQQIFFDRLQNYTSLAKANIKIRPTVFMIDFDNFRQINHKLGIAVGDTVLLIIARRLSRLINFQDTLSRLSADRFAIILLSETEPQKLQHLQIVCTKQSQRLLHLQKKNNAFTINWASHVE